MFIFIINLTGVPARRQATDTAFSNSATYRSCFKLALANGVRTIAFPAISCGVYGYPIPQAAAIALRETVVALQATTEIERVVFTCFTTEVLEAYQASPC